MKRKTREREIRQNQFLALYVIQQGKRVGLSSVGEMGGSLRLKKPKVQKQQQSN